MQEAINKHQNTRPGFSNVILGFRGWHIEVSPFKISVSEPCVLYPTSLQCHRNLQVLIRKRYVISCREPLMKLQGSISKCGRLFLIPQFFLKEWSFLVLVCMDMLPFLFTTYSGVLTSEDLRPSVTVQRIILIHFIIQKITVLRTTS